MGPRQVTGQDVAGVSSVRNESRVLYVQILTGCFYLTDMTQAHVSLDGLEQWPPCVFPVDQNQSSR